MGIALRGEPCQSSTCLRSGTLNNLGAGLAGSCWRYTPLPFLIFGHTRIRHRVMAREQRLSRWLIPVAGEWITSLGAYPSLEIGPLLDSHTLGRQHDS